MFHISQLNKQRFEKHNNGTNIRKIDFINRKAVVLVLTDQLTVLNWKGRCLFKRPKGGLLSPIL